VSAQSGEADTVPEGAPVHITERRGGLLRIVWGNAEGWVLAGQVRELAGRAADGASW
jgi:hypothetical protein